MVADYIDENTVHRSKRWPKGAASRKITIAVRRTYVKRSLIDALKESVMNVARN